MWNRPALMTMMTICRFFKIACGFWDSWRPLVLHTKTIYAPHWECVIKIIQINRKIILFAGKYNSNVYLALTNNIFITFWFYSQNIIKQIKHCNWHTIILKLQLQKYILMYMYTVYIIYFLKGLELFYILILNIKI